MTYTHNITKLFILICSAIVRSLALLESDIWGWRQYRREKSDAKSFHVLTTTDSATKLEAVLWITGLYHPIWVLVAVQAFGFLISILDHGDVMELALKSNLINL